MGKVRRLLDRILGPIPWYVLLVFAFIMRVEHRVHFPNIYLDTQVQMVLADRMLAGESWALPRIDTTVQAWQIVEEDMHRFVPAYAWGMAGIYQVTENWVQAAIGVDILGLILIFWGLHMIFYHWGRVGGLGYKMWWIFLALSPAPLHYLTGSGILALGFFLVGLACWIREWEHRRLSVLLIVGLVCIVLSIWVRAAYLPLLGVVPLVYFYQFQWRQAILIWGLMAISGVILAAGVGLMIVWQSQGPSYLPGQSQGFFPSHLLYIDPFPLKSLIYWGVPHEQQLYQIHLGWVWGLRVLAWVISLGLCVQLYRILRGLSRDWQVLVGCLILLNVGSLIYLSLVWPPENWNWIGFWTFVMEPRYFVPSMILMAVLWFGHSFDGISFPQKKMLRLFLVMLTILAYTYPLYIKVRTYVVEPEISLTHYLAWMQAEEQPDFLISFDPLYVLGTEGVISIPFEEAQRVLPYFEGESELWLLHEEGRLDECFQGYRWEKVKDWGDFEVYRWRGRIE
ncbi:MAG: hypothetical protein AAFW00_26045 [Bacteroidota bacterium]